MRPPIVLIVGECASGKSTLAEAIAWALESLNIKATVTDVAGDNKPLPGSFKARVDHLKTKYEGRAVRIQVHQANREGGDVALLIKGQKA